MGGKKEDLKDAAGISVLTLGLGVIGGGIVQDVIEKDVPGPTPQQTALVQVVHDEKAKDLSPEALMRLYTHKLAEAQKAYNAEDKKLNQPTGKKILGGVVAAPVGVGALSFVALQASRKRKKSGNEQEPEPSPSL